MTTSSDITPLSAEPATSAIPTSQASNTASPHSDTSGLSTAASQATLASPINSKTEPDISTSPKSPNRIEETELGTVTRGIPADETALGGTPTSGTAVTTGADEVASVGGTPNSAVLEAAISEDVELGTVARGIPADEAVLGGTPTSGTIATTEGVAASGIVVAGAVATADGGTNSAVVETAASTVVEAAVSVVVEAAVPGETPSF